MPDAREMKVARLLTDELSAEERARLEADVRANAEDAELETQMRGTLGALQSWAEAEDRRPRAVPMASRTKKPAFRRSMAAAAVVAILLLGGATFQLLRQPQVTQATNPPRGGQAVKGSEFAELAWVASLSSTETPRPGGEITFRDPGESGFGGGGGAGHRP